MGKFNSSTTRVAPVFTRLMELDPTGARWLSGLLKAGGQRPAMDTIDEHCTLIAGHKATWGAHELSLPPPQELLEHLVQTITSEQVEASGDQGDVREFRCMLAERDLQTVTDALKYLRAGSRGRGWFVLEGASRPDAVLEMAEAVVVVEGKRTERYCTSTTKWMGMRSQLLRHMDAAHSHFRGKRIYGLMIVEGENPTPLRPSAHWIEEAAAHGHDPLLSASLPHRSLLERQMIRDGLLGVTTWQFVCESQQLPWPPAPDVC